MPADPDTLVAIHALSENLNKSVEAKLTLFKEDADKSRQRIHDRIDEHARESRHTQEKHTAELRGAITLLGTQVTDLSARFGSHEKADAKEFERVDDKIKDIENGKKSYVQLIFAAIISVVAGWFASSIDKGN